MVRTTVSNERGLYALPNLPLGPWRENLKGTKIPLVSDVVGEVAPEIARDTAVKARTQAMLALKAVIIAVPATLREKLDAIAGTMALVRHLAALRPGAMTSPTASVKASQRALARRWLDLDAEIKAHDAHLEALVEHSLPVIGGEGGACAAGGVGLDPAGVHRRSRAADECDPQAPAALIIST